MARGDTRYSEEVEGAEGNFHRTMRVDVTDGFVGISTWENKFTDIDRVLLTPDQVTQLLVFLRRRR